MVYCQSLEEFVQKNDADLTRILSKKFKKIIQYYPIEDLKADIYLRLHRKQYIEKYRPFETYLDPSTNEYIQKPAKAKFSTYMCTFIYRQVYSFYTNDFEKDETNRTFVKQDNYRGKYLPDYASNINIKQILEHLKEKENKGTLIVDTKNELEKKILSYIDKYQECNHNQIAKALDETSEKIKNILKTLEEKGILKSKIGNFNDFTDYEIIYSLNNVKRRSLYNLFLYYLEGYKDKEISKEFKITVAGVCSMKNNLRKEIKKFLN